MVPIATVEQPMNARSGRVNSVPSFPPSMRMKWHDLLFMHWPVDPEALADHIPDGLRIETFESNAWVSVVPFRMSGVAPRWMPDIPWVSSFPELNVRTYVTCHGVPGVWFFSLDATNPLAVRIARFWFHLNYVDAKIRLDYRDNWIRYRSIRTSSTHAPANLSVDYRAIGDCFYAEPGSLEDWLTARYRLFSANSAGEIYCGEIDHHAWQLRKAQAIIHHNTMLDAFQHEFSTQPALIQFASRTDVVAWKIQAV